MIEYLDTYFTKEEEQFLKRLLLKYPDSFRDFQVLKGRVCQVWVNTTLLDSKEREVLAAMQRDGLSSTLFFTDFKINENRRFMVGTKRTKTEQISKLINNI